MRHAYKIKENGASPVTEMAIVNTFTKLIFGDQAYTERELWIVEALSTMDDTLSSDDRKELGEYLRDLGVREMIQLVSRLQRYLADCANTSNSSGAKPVHSPKIHSPVQGRETP